MSLASGIAESEQIRSQNRAIVRGVGLRADAFRDVRSQLETQQDVDSFLRLDELHRLRGTIQTDASARGFLAPSRLLRQSAIDASRDIRVDVFNTALAIRREASQAEQDINQLRAGIGSPGAAILRGAAGSIQEAAAIVALMG